MDDSQKQFLDDIRQGLKESVEFYSPENKPERERWVGVQFLLNLGIAFVEAEVLSAANEPPDVLFRDAKFEIKEILDQGRKRHAEYKVALRKAEQATSPADLVELYDLTDITPQVIGQRVSVDLAGLNSQYPPAVRAELDLLFYVNLRRHLLSRGPMPLAVEFASFGWRSVSVLCGWASLVYAAGPASPLFLQRRVGAVTVRNME